MQVANLGYFDNKSEKDTNLAADLDQEVEESLLTKSSRVNLSPSLASDIYMSESNE